MTFYQSPILKNRSQKFNDIETLKNDELVILSRAPFLDSPQLIQICQQNESLIAVYSWDKYIRIFHINEESLDIVTEIKINDYILDMIFVQENQILLSTCQGQLIAINMILQKNSSSSTQSQNNIQFQHKIVMSNCVIVKMKYFVDLKILVMFGLSNQVVFYTREQKLKSAALLQFQSKIVDMQIDIDEIFIITEDGSYYMFEVKECKSIQLQNMPQFKTQISYFDSLNSYDCENKILCIANAHGQIEITQFNQWKSVNEQQMTQRKIVNMNFNYENERISSIQFLVFTETHFMVLTNHGCIQIWDTSQLKPIVVCQISEEMSKWMIIGFGYDWSEGIEGTKDVNYKPCIAYFDVEELIPLDLEIQSDS